MSTAVKSATGFINIPQLVVIHGADRGHKISLQGDVLTIGRDEANDFVLDDQKASRQHAQIKREGSQYIIVDLDSQHGLLVNGVKVKKSPLASGSIVTIGESQILFQIGEAPKPTAPAIPQPLQFPKQNIPQRSHSHVAPKSTSVPPYRPKQKSSPIMPMVVVVALVFGGLFLLDSNSKKKKETELRSEGMRDLEIESSQKRQEDLIREQAKLGKDTEQYKEAQASFIRGFRDYREGNYKRAILAFNAALSLYPNHVLAERYRSLSKRKLDELVQSSLREGKKNYELGLYRKAMSEYQNVMTLRADPEDKDFKEAKERHQEVQLILETQF